MGNEQKVEASATYMSICQMDNTDVSYVYWCNLLTHQSNLQSNGCKITERLEMSLNGRSGTAQKVRVPVVQS